MGRALGCFEDSYEDRLAHVGYRTRRLGGLLALASSFGLVAATGCGEDSSCVGSVCAEPHDPTPHSTPIDSAPDAASLDEGGATQALVSHDVACGSYRVYWPEEHDVLRWTLRCSTELAEAVGLPEGAVFDRAAKTIEWTPRLDQAGPFEIVVTEVDGTKTTVTGTVLDRFDAPDNIPIVDPTTYFEEHGLPVIHLSWTSDEPMYCKDAVPRDPVPAEIVVNGVAHVGAELRCRGSTSLAFPKKSFTLRFAKNSPFSPPPKLAAFAGRRRLVLTQTFDDNSQLRTRMGFELWNRLDPENIRIDHASVVVYIDGVYQGLYQLTENIGDHLMAARGFNQDGNIFKSISHAGNYRATLNNGAPKTDLTVGYEKSDGEPEDDFSDLERLLTWVSESSTEEIENTVDTMLRTEDFLDWYILMTTLMAFDNYGKNSNVYVDPTGSDQRFRYIPWDLNATWGQSWDMQRVTPTSQGKNPELAKQLNGIWERILESPTLTERLESRFAAALSGPMSLANTLYLFDQMSDEVHASALRDDRRWDAERRAYAPWTKTRTELTTFESERAYVRAWIQARWTHLTSLYTTEL